MLTTKIDRPIPLKKLVINLNLLSLSLNHKTCVKPSKNVGRAIKTANIVRSIE